MTTASDAANMPTTVRDDCHAAADRIAALEAQLAERVKARSEPVQVYIDHADHTITTTLKDAIEDMKGFLAQGWDLQTEAHFMLALSALEATPPALKVTEIVWHRLIDGDPEKTGRYIVGHRGMSAPATYHDDGPIKGWDRSVEAFTHWAIEPRAPDDGTPQLFKPEGQRLRQEALEIASWNALTAAQELSK